LTAIPILQWNDTGLKAPTEPEILVGALTDWDNAFGAELDKNLETPQGQLSTSLTNIIGEFNDMVLNLVNQVDPQFASGFMQDAIGKIYFLERKPAVATSVDCVCTGLSGTTIPAGTRVIDENNNIYECQQTGQIGVASTVTLPFANIATGPIAAPANTVNRIYRAILGWESVNNPTDGVIGVDVESRAAFELRRKSSVYLGSQGQLDSAYAAVFALDNVLDVYATQNLTATTETIGSTSYSLDPGEVYIAVQGGNSQQIAQAIYSKIVATALVGNTTINVTSQLSGQVTAITFNRPSAYAIVFEIDIKDDPLLPGNVIDLVKEAVFSAFNGNNNSERAKIGSTIFASSFYAPISLIDSRIKLIQVQVGHTVPGLANSVDVGIDQFPTLNISDITVNLI